MVAMAEPTFNSSHSSKRSLKEENSLILINKDLLSNLIVLFDYIELTQLYTLEIYSRGLFLIENLILFHYLLFAI